jgi:hypothetical protein
MGGDSGHEDNDLGWVMTSRHSVPTDPVIIDRWIAVGWTVVCPDFERPNHTIMRWSGSGDPRKPHHE